MIGPQKLTVIREKLREALSAAPDSVSADWLKQAATRPAGSKGREVLDSLERILNAGQKRRQRRSTRVGK